MSFSTKIKSAHDGTILEFLDYEGDYFKVRISGPNFDGMASVYFYKPESLTAFFRDLVVNWRSWQGKKEWSSLQDELEFTASSDSTGHISLSVQLRNGTYPFGWSLSAVLLLEAGNLEQIASDIEKFIKNDRAV